MVPLIKKGIKMPTPTITITHQELKRLLSQVKGTRIISIELSTVPQLSKPKTNPLSGRIRKIQKLNGVIGQIYSKSVNRQREREGKKTDFQAKKRTHLQKIVGTPLLVNSAGQSYVGMQPQTVVKSPIYAVDGTVRDLNDTIDGLALKSWLRSPQQRSSTRQEISKTVPYINCKLESIIAISGLVKGVNLKIQ